MSYADIIVIVLLIALLGFAVRGVLRRRKGGCCGDCSSCRSKKRDCAHTED